VTVLWVALAGGAARAQTALPPAIGHPGAVERVSVGSAGNQATLFSIHRIGIASSAITPDGRFVAFSSDAADLVLPDPGIPPRATAHGIFVRDRLSGITTIVPAQAPEKGPRHRRAGDWPPTGRPSRFVWDAWGLGVHAGPRPLVCLDNLLSAKQRSSMTISEIAKTLGRRGGLSRARRLSKRRRTEIARMGARARGESLRLAEAIRNNFDYVAAIHQLHPPRDVRPESVFSGPLPGIYEGQKKHPRRTATA
jgi:hypothetical protein